MYVINKKQGLIKVTFILLFVKIFETKNIRQGSAPGGRREIIERG
jgi:hypothetical protein